MDKEDDLKAESQRQRTFNGLTATEWASLSSSVWNDVSSTRSKKHLDHGATFPEKLCARLISMYSRKGDLVLDPFLGTGTTMAAALKAERQAYGIELTDRFFSVAEKWMMEILQEGQLDLFSEGEKPRCKLVKGDCLDALKFAAPSSVQLTLTSPPYADLIHKVVKDRSETHKNSRFVTENNSTTNLYSCDSRDLGNMPLDLYMQKVEKVMELIFKATRPGGYNAWVVKDYRDTKHGVPYIDLHSKIAQAGEKAGFLYHDLIIWDQNAHRKLVLLGYPSVFYVNQNHSYIVIMRKPR